MDLRSWHPISTSEIFKIDDQEANTLTEFRFERSQTTKIFIRVDTTFQSLNQGAPHFNAWIKVRIFGSKNIIQNFVNNVYLKRVSSAKLRNPLHASKAEVLQSRGFIFAEAQLEHLALHSLFHWMHVQQFLPKTTVNTHWFMLIARFGENTLDREHALFFVILNFFNAGAKQFGNHRRWIPFRNFVQKVGKLLSEHWFMSIPIHFSLGGSKLVLAVCENAAFSKSATLAVDPGVAEFSFEQFLLSFFGSWSFFIAAIGAVFSAVRVRPFATLTRISATRVLLFTHVSFAGTSRPWAWELLRFPTRMSWLRLKCSKEIFFSLFCRRFSQFRFVAIARIVRARSPWFVWFN